MRFYCASCNRYFDSDTPEELAREELRQTFPGVPVEDCLIVCDDCYYQEVPRA